MEFECQAKIILDPVNTWADAAAYDTQARKVASKFVENFANYADHVSDAVRAAGPLID